MRLIVLAARLAVRELRGGDLGALVMALIIAAAALAAVDTFSRRVELGLKAAANELLGGDLVIVDREPIRDDWVDEAQTRGLSIALMTEFPTVVFSGSSSLLVQAKAVADAYPLRGELLVADDLAGDASAANAPAAGSAWVDPRVLGELQLRIGDRVEIGDIDVRIGGVIRIEPDRSGGVFAVAPRFMINRDDLPRSGLLGPGSRARYSLLTAGEPAIIDRFRDWLEPRRQGAFFQTIEDSQQQISQAIDRAGRFLGLAALTAVLLAGVAIVVAAGQFARRNLDTVAILRTHGMQQRHALALFTCLLIFAATPSLLIGVGLGYGAQFILVEALGDLIPQELPGAGPMPLLAAFGTGLLVLLGFGLPPLARLRDVPPVRVLNRSADEGRRGPAWDFIVPALFAVGLLLWRAEDLRLAGIVIGGTVVALVGFALAAALVVALASRWRGAVGIGWRYGVANLARRRVAAVLQISGLGLGLCVLLMLGVVQSDLVDTWRSRVPDDAPNYFMINIQPHQVGDIERRLDEGGAVYSDIYPMAVARIAAVNGETPEPTSERARRRLERNANISWSADLPEGNRIMEGSWWQGGIEASLAESWARSMNVKVGDEITFRVADREITARVANIRDVAWDSFQVNFFILMSPESLEGLDSTWLTAAYLEPDRFQVLSDLVRAHPNVSVVDVGTIINRVRTIIDRVSITVRVVFGFTLAAGIVVLLAVLRSGLRERTFEGAVLRTLGGARAQLRRAVLAEFGLIGAIAGLLAALAALGMGWALAREVFEVGYRGSWWLPGASTVAMSVAIGLVGLWGARRVLATPPVVVIRDADDD